MVKSVLILFLLVTVNARADLFDFGSEKGSRENKLPQLIEKLKSLEMKDDPAFEDVFNQSVKAIESGIEQEKLFCSGEAVDDKGKTLASSQKQVCMRELKKQYLDATSTIFDLKKKYLGFIHEKQIQRLTEIQTKQKAEIEKNF